MEIVNELSLHKGDASTNSSSDLLKNIIQDFIPSKESYYINDDDNTINEKIPVNTFIKDISKFVVSEQGSNKLIVKRYGKDTIQAYLINTEAPTLDLVTIGKMALHKYYYNPAFNFPTTYQVSWSNIANEYLRSDFGKLLYFLVYDYITSLGAFMASDSILYSGSFRMWTKFMPSIVPYFALIVDGIAVPISKDEFGGILNKTGSFIEGIIGMKKYPPSMLKIVNITSGLSFVNGDYGFANEDSINSKSKIFPTDDSNKKVNFFGLIDYMNQKGESLKDLIHFIEDALMGKIVTNAKNYEKIQLLIMNLSDGTFAVKKQNGKMIVTSV